MKKQNILISLLSVFAMVACTPTVTPSNSANPESNSEAPQFENKVTISSFKVPYKLEAEKFDTTNWVPEVNYGGNVVIQEEKASGGAYLSAAKMGSNSSAVFYFELTAYSHVTFAAAYAQTDDMLEEAIEMDKTYVISVENVENFTLGENKILKARASETQWDLMTYNQQTLYPGTYKVTLSVMENVPQSTPSIDYVQFTTKDAAAEVIDPSTITEADIPDNDMRNLQQYKYVVEEDVYKYKTYATGADLSAPRGMKLRFEDIEDASKYYVEVSENADFSNSKKDETTEKFYYFQNAKLATKYYYRAATSEAGLASAKSRDITSSDQAPRVVNVPTVLNFRDIGGWDTSLVPGAKIKQGLYFRCAQLDAASGSTTSKLDTAGKGLAALKELGIKCDIDMRDSYNQPSRGAGPSKASTADWPVTFVSAAVPSGSEPVRWEGGTYQGTDIAAQYVTIFNAIANCDNEPAMLHCTYGADRTGIATFFLESLLGMSLEDMTKDYLWTQFTQGRNVKILESEGAEFPQWVSKTEACEGSSFADKMENHLMSFGIEKSTLEHIREIFVPGYVAKA